jgi:hypothetical protein
VSDGFRFPGRFAHARTGGLTTASYRRAYAGRDADEMRERHGRIADSVGKRGRTGRDFKHAFRAYTEQRDGAHDLWRKYLTPQ